MNVTPREKFLLDEIESSKKMAVSQYERAEKLSTDLKESNEWNQVLCAIVLLLFVFLVFAITHYRKMQYENTLLKEIHHYTIKTIKLKNDE